MHRWHLSALLLALSATAAGADVATPWNDHPHAKVRLIAGEGRMLGVELQLAPGWKTYWRMPGDAGVPPSFDWAGSDNIKAFDVFYPVPQTMPDQGGVAVGYKGNVIFPVAVAFAAEGKPAKAQLEFSFGVCREICIPIDSKLQLSLDGAKPWPAVAALKASVQKVPAVAADAGKAGPLITAIAQTGTGEKAVVTVTTAGALDVYFEAPDGLFVPLTKARAGGVFELDLAASADAKSLVGKALRITAVTATGGVETTHVVK